MNGEHYKDSGAPGTVTFTPNEVGDVVQTVLTALLKFVVYVSNDPTKLAAWNKLKHVDRLGVNPGANCR